MTKTTVDDIAREAGVSRATLYRAVPGGRDDLFEVVLASEIERFFTELSGLVSAVDDLEDALVVGVGASIRELWGHEALRTVLHLEPGVLLPCVAFHRLDDFLEAVAAFATPLLARFLADEQLARRGADHVTRIVLSYALVPAPRLDPHDEASVRSFVRRYVLPGLDRP